MAQQIINIGSTVNDGTGDTLRTGAQKINANFAELYLTTLPSQTGNTGKFLTTDGTGTAWATITDQITAAANILTGTTIASNVVYSSLTTVGTLTNLTVTNTINGSINGNSATVSNGVYINQVYENPGWLGSLAGSKITGDIVGNAGTVTNGVYTNQIYNNPIWISALSESKVLPSQVGQSGKFLTSNGATSSWGSITSLPGGAPNKILFQSGIGVTDFITAPVSAGTYLKWNGTGFEWTATGAGQGTVTSLSVAGTVQGLTLTGGITQGGSTGTITLGGAITLTSSNITTALGFNPVQLGSFSVTTASASGGGSLAFNSSTGVFTFTPPAPPVGTVSSVSFTAANGFTGSVATATSTPAISVGTSITGLLKGNGTSISAAVAGTDYFLPFGSQAANTVYAAPNAASGSPTFRALVAGDIPLLNQNTTGSAAKLSVARNINGNPFDGSADISVTVPAATGITGLAGSMASFLTTASSASLANTLTDETGSGLVVFNNTPSITSPDISTSITTPTTGTFNLVNTNATTVNFAGASTATTIGASTGTTTINSVTLTLPNATALNINGTNPTLASTSTGTLTLFNTGLTTINFGNAATTVSEFGPVTNFSLGNTATAAQTVNMFTASTGASTYNFATGATGAVTKAINIGTNGGASSTTNIAIGSTSGTSTVTLNGSANITSNVSSGGNITVTGGTSVIGYATGSGGTVTQGTNRSTGVSIDKASGSITLFNTTTSAGQVTSFTVTNNRVAATDTVILAQKTGTGVYFLGVTNITTNSFVISVFTPAAVGSAEAPVINFTVIKGVAA
jgi:hypothetical protein